MMYISIDIHTYPSNVLFLVCVEKNFGLFSFFPTWPVSLYQNFKILLLLVIHSMYQKWIGGVAYFLTHTAKT